MATTKKSKIKPDAKAASQAPHAAIRAALLKLLATDGWAAVNLDRIAKTAKLPLPQLQKFFASKQAILAAILEETDRATLAALRHVDSDSSVHEQVLEALMTRLDVLQTDRAAYRNLMNGAKSDPALAAMLARRLGDSMQTLVDAADKTSPALARKLAATGLFMIYIKTLCIWLQDVSIDLSRTMAGLDKNLRRAGKIAEIIFRAI